MLFEHEVASSSHSSLAGINIAGRGLSLVDSDLLDLDEEDEEKAKRVSDIS